MTVYTENKVVRPLFSERTRLSYPRKKFTTSFNNYFVSLTADLLKCPRFVTFFAGSPASGPLTLLDAKLCKIDKFSIDFQWFSGGSSDRLWDSDLPRRKSKRTATKHIDIGGHNYFDPRKWPSRRDTCFRIRFFSRKFRENERVDLHIALVKFTIKNVRNRFNFFVVILCFFSGTTICILGAATLYPISAQVVSLKLIRVEFSAEAISGEITRAQTYPVLRNHWGFSNKMVQNWHKTQAYL
jgi:hypothetical protein